MADKFDDLLQEFVNLDYSELLAGAKTGLSEAIRIFSRFGSKEGTTAAVVSFLASAIAVDGSFSALEQKLIRDLFGDVDFMGILKTVDSKMIETVDSLVDSLPDDDKYNLCTFAIYILAVDEHITKEEYRYLNKLLA
jgi:hypothetical protein